MTEVNKLQLITCNASKWVFSKRVARVLGVIFALGIMPQKSEAMQDPAKMCDEAAKYASVRIGVPLEVLRALTRTETGRSANGQFSPWPWTVNMEGLGRWFDTRDQAEAFAFTGYKSGARSFDVGCFQINYKWHGQAFTSLEDMFDPQKNALYAAQFLRSLYGETENWLDAAAAYHSRTPEFAKKYKSRFERILAQLGRTTPSNPKIVQAMAPAKRVSLTNSNAYPLLKQGQVSGSKMGSLMPLPLSAASALWFQIGG